MGFLANLVGTVAGLVSLVCLIVVLVKMFQHGHIGLAIGCIVLLFCLGIGYLVALVYGWNKADAWNIRNLMMAWTVAFVLMVLMGGIGYALSPWPL
jgi:hypothetical protein